MGILTDWCPGADPVRQAYGIFSAAVMMIFSARMLDLSVLNNTLSAYVITAGRVLRQVFLYLVGFTFTTAAFACTVTALMETHKRYLGIPRASLSFLLVGFHMEDQKEFQDILDRGTGWVFVLVAAFIAAIDMFLFNLLIAQICSEHQAVYDDMVGYARIRRIQTIYFTMPYVNKVSWTKWIVSLGLDQRLEFNRGDVGLSGGIQVTEPANLNPTLVEQIIRFGGSTSQAAPWPVLEEADEEKNGMDRLEKMAQKNPETFGEHEGQQGGQKKQQHGQWWCRERRSPFQRECCWSRQWRGLSVHTVELC